MPLTFVSGIIISPIMMRFILFCCFIFLSCNNQYHESDDKGKSDHSKNAVLQEASSMIALDPRLSATDSLVFVFYKDPLGTDSLRYTRYYRQYSSIDSSLIHSWQSYLHGKTTMYEKVKPCRSEGKIWCFFNGRIFQTIYYAAYNRDCNFLYIIRNGLFYYSDLDSHLASQLNSLKSKAIELPNEGK